MRKIIDVSYCLIIVYLISISCQSDPSCKYFGSLELYFKSVFDIKLSERNGKVAYYFVPLESCENCIYSNLLMLNKLKTKKITIIFIGKNYHNEWDEVLAEIKNKYNFLEDDQKQVYGYESGLGKPLLLVVNDGDCSYSKTIYERNLEEVSIEIENL